MEAKKYVKRKISWWFWFLVADSTILAASVLLVYTSRDEFTSKIAYYAWANLSLGAEMTFAVWWSGFLILLVGLICYENFSTSKGRIRFAWLVLSILFILLSVDEVGSIHERTLGSGASSLIFVFVGSLFLLPAFLAIIYDEKTRRNGILLLTGSGLMASVALQETIEHSINWSESVYALRLGIEEGSEIFGALICLIAAVNCRKRVDWPSQISRAIPNPHKMRRVPSVIIGALAVHAFTTLYFFEQISMSSQGDPLIFFPYSISIFLFSYIYWDKKSQKRYYYDYRLAYSLLFLTYSLSSFYLLSTSFGLLDDTTRLSIYSGFVLLVLLLSTLYSDSKRGLTSSQKAMVLFLGISVLTLCLLTSRQILYYVMSGVLAVLVYELITGAMAPRMVLQEQ